MDLQTGVVLEMFFLEAADDGNNFFRCGKYILLSLRLVIHSDNPLCLKRQKKIHQFCINHLKLLF